MTESAPHVLVVDDEPQILRGLKVILRSAGFQVAQAATKREALDAIAVRPPDVMILDLVLPDGNGVEVCEEVRRWSTLPIIVLSAVGDEREKVRALDAGADDYVTKPFGTEELTARIRAALRRRDTGDTGDPVVRVGAVTIDLAARRVTRDDAEVHLTPIEFDLLRVLAAHRGTRHPLPAAA
jgi:two-component system, OmpR family, KDP operon response regulator KdpE